MQARLSKEALIVSVEHELRLMFASELNISVQHTGTPDARNPY
jgi:hypothetical protein